MKHCSRMLVIDPHGEELYTALQERFEEQRIHIALADTREKIARLFQAKHRDMLFRKIPLAPRFQCAAIQATADLRGTETHIDAPNPIALAIRLAHLRVPTLLYSPSHERQECIALHRMTEESNICTLDASVIPEAAHLCVNRRKDALHLIATMHGLRSKKPKKKTQALQILKKMLKKADPPMQKALCTILRFEDPAVRELIHDLQIM